MDRLDVVNTIWFAGWLIALMVWLMPAAQGSRLAVIVIITYVIGIGEFAHVIAGSVDKLLLVTLGKLSASGYLWGFLAPALLGNIIGGVSLVAREVHGSGRAATQHPLDAVAGQHRPLGDVDSHRAPCDAPPAADAA